VLAIAFVVKVYPSGSFLHEMDSWPKVLYKLRSGNWLAWANDTAVHYAAIHCPH